MPARRVHGVEISSTRTTTLTVDGCAVEITPAFGGGYRVTVRNHGRMTPTGVYYDRRRDVSAARVGAVVDDLVRTATQAQET